MPTSGLLADCGTGAAYPIYYPAWVLITGTQDFIEIGTAFPCTTDWYWYEAWMDFQGFHWKATQDKPALADGHYFQMYRANEVWHWQIGNTEPTPPMYWNAVGYQANAGLESYLNLGVTDYLTHDLMNVALSESPWLSFSGFANVSDGGLRMCSVGITANSFKERERPSGTSC